MQNHTQFSPRRLQKARGARRREELAAVAGVTTQTIKNWEAGKSEPPASRLAALASFLGRPLGWFFEGRP